MSSLPNSLQLIGWVYTALGILIVGFAIWLFFNQSSTTVNNEPSIFRPEQQRLLNLMLTAFGLGVLAAGQGILRKNKIAFFAALIFIALFFTNPLGLLLIPFNGFVIWKLLEHRKLFGL